MNSVRFLAPLVAAIFLSACASDSQAQNPPESLTRFLSKPESLPGVPLSGKDLPWYASVRVTAQAAPVVAGKDPSKILNVTGARSFLQKIGTFLGVNNEKEGYAFVIVPTIAGLELPPITALKLAIENNQPKLELSQAKYSPWVPFDKGAMVALKVMHSTNTDSSFDLFSETSQFAAAIPGIGGWAVSEAVLGPLKLLTGKLDKGFRNLSYVNVGSNIADEFYPFSASTTDSNKGVRRGYKYTLLDTDGVAFVVVNIEVIFRRTLREPAIEESGMNVNSLPSMQALGSGLNSPSYRFIDSKGNLTDVANVLATSKSIASALGRNTASVEAFTDACDDVSRLLTDKGYNSVDATYILAHLIEPTIRTRPDLYSSVWSRCFSQSSLELAKQIGIATLFDRYVPETQKGMNVKSANALAAYIVNKSNDERVLIPIRDAARAGIASAVSLAFQGSDVSDPITDKEALDQLRKIEGTTANYHCIEPAQKGSGNSRRTGYTAFLRMANNKPDLVVALYTGALEAADAPAKLLEIRAPTDDEFNNCKAVEERRAQQTGNPVDPPKK